MSQEGRVPPAPTVSEWIQTLGKFSKLAEKFEYTEWEQVYKFTVEDLVNLDIPGPMATPLSKLIAGLPLVSAPAAAKEEPVKMQYEHTAGSQAGEKETGWTDSSVVQVGFVVLQRFAGLLIGKKGMTVKKITQESKCKHINFGEGMLPGTDMQLMIMKGTTDQVMKAVEKSCDLMESFSATKKSQGEAVSSLPAGQCELMMLVPDEHVPKIIGKKGANIKSVQSEAGCKMKVSDERLGAEKFLMITGTPANVSTCVNLVIRSLPFDMWSEDRPIFQQAYSGRSGGGARPARDPYISMDMYDRDPYGPPRGYGGYDEYDYGYGRGPMGRNGYDDYGPESSPAKRRKIPGGAPVGQDGEVWTDATVAQVGFVVQKLFAGLLIGQKGATVKKLTKHSRCKHINFGDGTLPGTDQQLMIMKGTTTQIMTAVEMACELMDTFARTKKGQGEPVSSHPDGMVEIKMLVLEDQVPMVIGKKGSRIKAVETETGTKMKFGDQAVGDEKLLTILGAPYGVALCVNSVIRGLPVDVWSQQREAFGQAYKGGAAGNERKGGKKGGGGGGSEYRTTAPASYEGRFPEYDSGMGNPARSHQPFPMDVYSERSYGAPRGYTAPYDDFGGFPSGPPRGGAKGGKRALGGYPPRAPGAFGR